MTLLTFEIKGVSTISINKQYPGIHVDIVAKIKNTKTPFGIDLGIGDIIVPGAVKRVIPTQLEDFSAPTVSTYSVETTIAEKLDAILGLLEFSNRMKDYYDIYYLANKFDFSGETLTEALRKTFDNRGRDFTVNMFEEVLTFSNNKAMQQKWSAFCRKTGTESDLETVLEIMQKFLFEPYSAVISGKKYSKTRNCQSQRWE